MNYDLAAERFVDVKRQLEELDAEYKAKKAPLVEKLNMLESWFTAKAAEDGLDTIKTPHGTVFWTVLASASVADRAAFFDYVRASGNFDLLEARANKTVVKDFVALHGGAPPGVNYSTVKNLNFRKAKKENAND